jgi:hypothetical protein
VSVLLDHNTTPRLGEFYLSEDLELDLESLPLLSVEKRPVYDNNDMMFIKERIAKVDRELISLDIFHQLLALNNRLDRIYEEALKLNRDYWNKIVIDTRHIDPRQKCFNHVGLTRIFKDGGVWRWFQKGEMSFQQLPEEERVKLLINGERVTEIDYSAMHPHILYAWENEQCPDDFYERIMDRCGCSRFIAKSVSLIAINASSYVSLVGAINNDKRKTEIANKNRAIPEPVLYNELKKQNLTPRDVVEAIELAHPVIAKYVYKGLANKLMLVESDIMTSVLLELMSLGIPVLPVHDSVIVPSRYEGVARRVMGYVYTEQIGFNISIK